MTGKGIDRHLLGLQLVLHEDEASPLFDDWVFNKSQEWKLSTSGLSAGLYFRGTGYAFCNLHLMRLLTRCIALERHIQMVTALIVSLRASSCVVIY